MNVYASGLPWLLAAPSLLALGVTAVNAVSWPRGRRALGTLGARSIDRRHVAEPRTSALVPARNEAAGIEACVRALLAEPFEEVVVYDDGSTDATPDILARLSSGEPRLRVLRGAPLPDGWIGKPHACQRLGEAASGDVLLFVDADVRLEAGALTRVHALLDSVDVLTAVPRQVTGSFVEHLVLPLLHLTYVSWLPLAMIPLTSDARVLAANGQLLAVRREAWTRLDGFSEARADVVDDMAFCRAAKRRGLRVRFADGHLLAHCRMYEDAASVWRGFSKNLYEGLGASPIALLGVLGLYGTAFVLPFTLLPLVLSAGPSHPLHAAVVVAVVANLMQRGWLALRHGHSLVGVVLHPVAVSILLAIAVNSWRWHAKGAIAWRGRVYAARSERGQVRASDRGRIPSPGSEPA